MRAAVSVFVFTHAASEHSVKKASNSTNWLSLSFCECWLMTSMGIIMVPAAVLKLYAIGTLLYVFAVIFELGNSVGGLMYSPDYRYINELNHQTHGEIHSCDHLRGRSVNKNVGS